MSNPSIYINPKFRNVHINPNFLTKCHNQSISSEQPPKPPPAKPTNIFVNPNFLRPNQPILQQQSVLAQQVTDSSFTYHQLQPTPLAPKFTQAKIISQTNRKLVRQPIAHHEPLPLGPQTKSAVPTTASSSPLLRIGIRKLVRRGTAASIGPVATSRLSPIRHTVSLKAKYASSNLTNQYKLDRRLAIAGRPILGASHQVSKHKLLGM